VKENERERGMREKREGKRVRKGKVNERERGM